ncbi:MAG: serine--tRNA ligase, partial [Proteobacteria bacterium]|nr:serine--tRNA ligase [Pseudomonadota bacterium]
MIDINLLRETLDEVVKKLKSRGYEFDTKFFINLEKDRKSFQIKTQELQEMRNQLSKNIGVEKSQGKNIDELMAKVSDISADLKKFEISFNETQLKLNNYLLEIPNIPHDSVPLGRNEKDNIVVREIGKKKTFNFEVKDHVDVASQYGLDFDLGTKLSGSRFTLMRS